jgi:hypothetical protein
MTMTATKSPATKSTPSTRNIATINTAAKLYQEYLKLSAQDQDIFDELLELDRQAKSVAMEVGDLPVDELAFIKDRLAKSIASDGPYYTVDEAFARIRSSEK